MGSLCLAVGRVAGPRVLSRLASHRPSARGWTGGQTRIPGAAHGEENLWDLWPWRDKALSTWSEPSGWPWPKVTVTLVWVTSLPSLLPREQPSPGQGGTSPCAGSTDGTGGDRSTFRGGDSSDRWDRR